MTLHGLDISHYQQGLSLSRTGLDFAIMKATEGTSYVDSACDSFVNGAKNAGMLYGVYHFAHTGSDAEADHFIQATKGYHGHGILVLDWEADAVSHGVSAAKNWLDRVRSKTGIAPLIYMSQSVATSHDWSSVAKDYALWVARYNDEIGPTGAWSSVAMWQYTSSGKVTGYSGSVDLDRFYGDANTWHAFAAGNTNNTQPDTEEDEMDCWSETITKWAPESTPNQGAQISAAMQLNQARGYAEDAWDRTVKIEGKVDDLTKKVDQLIQALNQ